MQTSEIISGLLEGKPLSSLIKNPEKESLVGKTLTNVVCEACNETGTVKVTRVLDTDQGFYNVLAKCESCGEPMEVELVIKEGTEIHIKDTNLLYEGNAFFPITESGIMNGNYLKFGNSTRGWIIKNDTGENELVFEEPDQPAKPLNVRVTFKVISFRNGKAKLVAMTKDNVNGFPEGTLIYADKKDLQQNAKIAKPRMNSGMAGRFKY